MSQEKPTGQIKAIEAVGEALSEGEGVDDVVAQGLEVRFGDAVCVGVPAKEGDAKPDVVFTAERVPSLGADAVGLDDEETAEVSDENPVVVEHSLLVAEGEGEEDGVFVLVAVGQGDPDGDIEFFKEIVPSLGADTVGRNDKETAKEPVVVEHSVLVAEEEGEEDGVFVLVAVGQGDPDDVKETEGDPDDVKKTDGVIETEAVVHPESVTVPEEVTRVRAELVAVAHSVAFADPEMVCMEDGLSVLGPVGDGYSLLVAEEEGDKDTVCVEVPVKEDDPEGEKVFTTVGVPPLSTDPVACFDGVAVPLFVAPPEEEGEAVVETLNADCRFEVTIAINPRYSSTASVVHCTVRKRPVVVHELAAGTEKPEIPAPLFSAGLPALEPSYRKS